MEIDFHNYTYSEAIEILIKKYNEAIKNKISEIKIIHGYGSNNNQNGVLRKKIRNFLNENNIIYRTGEEISANMGYTLIYVSKQYLSNINILGLNILKFCTNSKTIEKINSKFFSYKSKEILEIIKIFEKKGYLKVNYNLKSKVYKTSINLEELNNEKD